MLCCSEFLTKNSPRIVYSELAKIHRNLKLGFEMNQSKRMIVMDSMGGYKRPQKPHFLRMATSKSPNSLYTHL